MKSIELIETWLYEGKKITGIGSAVVGLEMFRFEEYHGRDLDKFDVSRCTGTFRIEDVEEVGSRLEALLIGRFHIEATSDRYLDTFSRTLLNFHVKVLENSPVGRILTKETGHMLSLEEAPKITIEFNLPQVHFVVDISIPIHYLFKRITNR